MKTEPCTTEPTQPTLVGKIGQPYGVYGWLKLFSSTEETENIFNYKPWFIKKTRDWQIIKVENWKRHNHNLIIKLKGIEKRDTAANLTNYEIIIDALQLPNLNNGEYYWKDLIGCQVYTIYGYKLGIVIGLIETGSNDVLVVRNNLKDIYGINERLIPFLYKQVIKSVDINTHIIEIEWDLSF